MMMIMIMMTTMIILMKMIMMVVVVMVAVMMIMVVVFHRTVDRFLSCPSYVAPYPRRARPQLFVCAVLASLPLECAGDVNGGACGRILFGRHRLQMNYEWTNEQRRKESKNAQSVPPVGS